MANALRNIGDEAVRLIRQGIDDKISPDGSAYADYSFEYWFAKYKRKRSNIGKNQGKVRGKKAKAWERLKAAAYSEWLSASGATLIDTGAMAASLSIIAIGGMEIKIGFSDTESARKAFYHNISGSGQSRVLRRFMGLSDSQSQELSDYAAQQISTDKQLLINIFKKFNIDVY